MTTATTAQTPRPGSQTTTGAAYETLRERGFFYQCSDEAGLAEALAHGPVTYYVGFDRSEEHTSELQSH